MQRGRRCILTHVLIPAELCDACSGRLKPHELRINSSFSRDCVPFHRAAQDRGNPQLQLLYYVLDVVAVLLAADASAFCITLPLQLCEFVSVTNGASVRMFLCRYVCRPLPTPHPPPPLPRLPICRNTSKSGPIGFHLLNTVHAAHDNGNPHFPSNPKEAAQPQCTIHNTRYTIQQPRYNNNCASTSCLIVTVTTVLLCACAVLSKRSKHDHIFTSKENINHDPI